MSGQQQQDTVYIKTDCSSCTNPSPTQSRITQHCDILKEHDSTDGTPSQNPVPRTTRHLTCCYYLLNSLSMLMPLRLRSWRKPLSICLVLDPCAESQAARCFC